MHLLRGAVEAPLLLFSASQVPFGKREDKRIEKGKRSSKRPPPPFPGLAPDLAQEPSQTAAGVSWRHDSIVFTFRLAAGGKSPVGYSHLGRRLERNTSVSTHAVVDENGNVGRAISFDGEGIHVICIGVGMS